MYHPRQDSSESNEGGRPRVCVLHIGLEKTGTTSIQTWLYANERSLLAQGIGLTHAFSIPNNWDFVNFFQNKLDDWAVHRRIRTLKDKKRYFANFEGTLGRELENLNVPRVVITSEHFSSRLRTTGELEKLRDFLSLWFDEIKILAWFRPQWEVATSSWSTSIKSGNTEQLDTWLSRIVETNYYFNYKRIADNWASVFGNSNCYFRPLQTSGIQPSDSVKEFQKGLEFAGCVLRLDNEHSNFPKHNGSLGHVEALVTLAINRAVEQLVPSKDEIEILRMKEILHQGLPSIESRFPIVVPHEARQKIFKEFRQSNEAFFATYFPEGGFGKPEGTPVHPTLNGEDLLVDLTNIMGYLVEAMGKIIR